jgi:hypothetical protein
MDISSIVKLVKDINQDLLYDFFVIDYDFSSSITLYPFTVRMEHEMRIGLILNEIYGGNYDNYIDVFCELNDIDNPLNVMEGDILYYCDLDAIGTFKKPDEEVKSASNNVSNTKLINPNKVKKLDNKRQDYINNNFTLNPNYNNGSPNIKVEKNKITIGRN